MARISRIERTYHLFISEIRTTVRRNLLFLRRFFDLGSHGYRGWRNDESALSVKSVPSVVTPTLAAALPRWAIRGQKSSQESKILSYSGTDDADVFLSFGAFHFSRAMTRRRRRAMSRSNEGPSTASPPPS